MKSKIARLLARFAFLSLLVYLGLAAFVFFNQRKYIYSPQLFSEQEALGHAQLQRFEPWRNPAGEIIGWKRLAVGSTNHEQVLVFHGNGGSALIRLPLGDEIQAVAPFDIYVLEYPGYGSRPGTPSESGIFKAAAEGVELLKSHPVYIVGESLGTGVASYIAGKYPELVRGVFLLAPYDELVSVAGVRMPYFPVRLMLLDRFRSTFHLRKYHGPVAVLLGGNDHIVPNRFGHRLYDKYQGPKKLWEVPDADHGDLFDRRDSISRWREIIAFWGANSAPQKID
jgi:pimeloyl-ACP methyl ester carboxylesterase